MTGTTTNAPAVPAPPPRTWSNVVRAFFRNPLATAALVGLATVVLGCALASAFFPKGPNAVSLGDSLRGPSAAHLLGTDQLGRDLLARVLFGGRATLVDALLVTAVAIGVGVALGLVAAYTGGWVDRVITLLTDVGLAVPAMIVMLVALSLFRGTTWVAMLLLGLLLAPPIVRNIRGPALAVRRELFVDAAVVAGLSAPRIVVKHVLPRVIGPILVQGALAAAIALQFTTGLAFLGFGALPPDPDWGSTIAQGSQVLTTSPWPIVAGGLALGLTTLMLVLIGDGARDVAVDAWSGAPARRRRRPTGRLAPAPERTDRPEPPEGRAAEGALVSVRGLTVDVEVDGRSVSVVSDVDLDIAPGETVGIVGESGCGKTTVARALARLLPAGVEIAGGRIRFEGEDVGALRGQRLYAYRRSSVSYIAQDPMTALDPTLRVGTLLRRIVRATDGLSRKDADRRVVELLTQVQLPDPESVAKRYPHELSGGMAQRVGIARAIAARPRLLIADEPTTALDVTVQSDILTLLQGLQEQYGMAVLLVSHDWGVVAEVCDRAYVMYAGEVVELGVLHEVVNEPTHPYTAALLACRPSTVMDDSLPLPTIRGSVVAPGDWPVGCRFAARCEFRTAACTEHPVQMAQGAQGHQERCIRPLGGIRTIELEGAEEHA